MKLEEYKVGDIVIFNGRRPWIFNGVSDDGRSFYITDNILEVVGMKLKDGTEIGKGYGYACPVSEFDNLITFYARPIYADLSAVFDI